MQYGFALLMCRAFGALGDAAASTRPHIDRSPGEFQSGPDVVLGDGRIYNCSGHYNRNLVGVRPAIVLKGHSFEGMAGSKGA